VRLPLLLGWSKAKWLA